MLEGTWHLVEWDCTLDDQYLSHPFGRGAQGMLQYTADGHMAAILMRPERPLFAKPNLASGTAEEKIAAVNGYVSYAGTYRVEADMVIHTVEFSLLPNWIGTELVREISWTNDDPAQLILTTPPQVTRSGQAVVNRLRWQKVGESKVQFAVNNLQLHIKEGSG